MVPHWLAPTCSGQEKLDRTQRIARPLQSAVRYRAAKGCPCWQVTVIVSASVLSAREKALWLACTWMPLY